MSQWKVNLLYNDKVKLISMRGFGSLTSSYGSPIFIINGEIIEMWISNLDLSDIAF